MASPKSNHLTQLESLRFLNMLHTACNMKKVLSCVDKAMTVQKWLWFFDPSGLGYITRAEFNRALGLLNKTLSSALFAEIDAKVKECQIFDDATLEKMYLDYIGFLKKYSELGKTWGVLSVSGLALTNVQIT